MPEEKPWYMCVEFWTPIVGSIAVLVMHLFGIELPTESLVTVIVFIGYIVWSRVSQRNKVIEARIQAYVVNREFDILRMETGQDKGE